MQCKHQIKDLLPGAGMSILSKLTANTNYYIDLTKKGVCVHKDFNMIVLTEVPILFIKFCEKLKDKLRIGMGKTFH